MSRTNRSNHMSTPLSFPSCPIGRLLALLLGSLVALTLAACKGGGERKARQMPPVPVRVGPVVRKTVPVRLRAVGHVESIATVAVRPRVGGELTKVWFAQGASVRAGSTLFTIDPRAYEMAVRQAEAQLARDQALLRKADADITRYADLVKQDFVTKEQFDQINANADALRAAVAADQASLENARLNLSFCTITAPFDGRTGDLLVKVGNLVKANDTTLVTVNQIKPIYVDFSLPAQQLPQIVARRTDGLRVDATLPNNAGTTQGVLTFIDNAVDETTATIMLKATFTNTDELLWPGQFVDVVVTVNEEPNRVVAPAPAVQTSQQGQYVFVVKEDQTVEMRTVKVNRMDEREAVIEQGLAGGETVVTDGQLRLLPGAKVQVLEGANGAAEKRR
jgi:multidrug efflux system membrane fusion protein